MQYDADCRYLKCSSDKRGDNSTLKTFVGIYQPWNLFTAAIQRIALLELGQMFSLILPILLFWSHWRYVDSLKRITYYYNMSLGKTYLGRKVFVLNSRKHDINFKRERLRINAYCSFIAYCPMRVLPGLKVVFV